MEIHAPFPTDLRNSAVELAASNASKCMSQAEVVYLLPALKSALYSLLSLNCEYSLQERIANKSVNRNEPLLVVSGGPDAAIAKEQLERLAERFVVLSSGVVSLKYARSRFGLLDVATKSAKPSWPRPKIVMNGLITGAVAIPAGNWLLHHFKQAGLEGNDPLLAAMGAMVLMMLCVFAGLNAVTLKKVRPA